MTPREQDALNRRLQREAAERQAAQNARIERDRQANEAANRKASQDQWRRFNEGQEKIRRDNEARNRKEQERRDEHDKYMRKLREQQGQQSWGGRSQPCVRPSPPVLDYVPPGSGNTRTKKGGSAGKTVLFIIAAIFAIGYFGSHSDRSSSPSTAPEASTSSPTPAPSEPVARLWSRHQHNQRQSNQRPSLLQIRNRHLHKYKHRLLLRNRLRHKARENLLNLTRYLNNHSHRL